MNRIKNVQDKKRERRKRNKTLIICFKRKGKSCKAKIMMKGGIKGKVKCCNEVQVDWIVNKVRYKTQTETQAPFTLFSCFGGDLG